MARVVAPIPTRDDRRLVRTILFLSIALAGLLGLAAGFLLGFYSAPKIDHGGTQAPAKATPAVSETLAPPAQEEPPREKAPAPVETGDTEEAEAPEVSPIKVIAAPEAALKAFLSAPDWRTRLKQTLHGDRIASTIESYHREVADGPTKVIAMKVDASHRDDETGLNMVTYLVATEAHPKGFPVAIVETKDGWKVDWETFVEFEHDHFAKFAAGEGSETGAFHLMVRTTTYGKFPGGENLTAYRLDPPMEGSGSEFGYVATVSDINKSLAASTEPGHPATPVLQLTRRKTAEGKPYLEISGIVAPDWRPEPE